MKKSRKTMLKVLVLLLAAAFVSQALCFSTGKSYAEIMAVSTAQNIKPLSDSNDITISSVDQLVSWLASGDSASNVRLASDIGTTVFDLYGKDYQSKQSFTGKFDGAYCTIIGLNKPLFDDVNGATIENVYIGTTTTSPSGITTTNKSAVGAIACTATNATFKNCINNATITATYANETIYAGGIVGKAMGTTSITECSNHANITAGNTTNQVAAFAGGIVGYAQDTTKVKNSYVAPMDKSSVITIKAEAKTQTTSNTTFLNSGHSMHYNGLTNTINKMMGDVDAAQKELISLQNEQSSARQHLQSVKNNIDKGNREIQELKRQRSKAGFFSKIGYTIKIVKEACF